MKSLALISIAGALLIAGWLTGKRLASSQQPPGPAQNRIPAQTSTAPKPDDGFRARWNAVNALTDKSARTAELKSLAAAWAATDPQSAFEAMLKTASAGGEEEISLLMGLILSMSRTAGTDPADVASWMGALTPGILPPGQLSRIERAVAAAWRAKNPRKSADWLLSRATPESRSRHIASAVDEWVLTSPNACGEWLRSLPPGPDTDPAIETFARQIVREDPESALAWASRISDPALRDQLKKSILEKWRMSDPDAAAAFANQNP
jgi:hypothetical protein